MYDPDRDDPEWDEEVERSQLAAAQAHAQGVSSQQQQPRDRAIRPLPKRRRFSEEDLSRSRTAEEEGTGGGVTRKERRSSDDEQQDDGVLAPARASTASLQPALEYRAAADDDYHNQRGGTASNHPTKAREEDDSATKISLDSSRPTDEDLLDSPPTSPAGSRADLSYKEADEQDEELERGPNHFALFGSEGQTIRRSLLKASTFSAAGLCGGLGLAGLHPSLAPPPGPRAAHSAPASAASARGDEEVDEDGYAWTERRAYTSDGRLVSVPRGSGNNKKKRKIPGVSVGTGGDDDDRQFDAEDGPEPTTVIGPDNKGRAPGIRIDYGSEGITSRAPVNPPTTAKAALAKLRLRPLHISIVQLSLSHRRHSKRHYRAVLAKHKPLKLPPPAVYSAPALYRDGPPPLPPGSGLKGSRALKAAKKAEKDREKEKKRMKALLGGGNIRLIDLWDPEGKEESAAAIERANRRRRLASLDSKSTYPTPPSSTDGDRPSVPPVLDSFTFTAPAHHLVAARWSALTAQIGRFRLAKMRAAKAREQERERRKEKEKELAAQAEAEEATVDKKAPPPPPTGKRNSTAAIRPPVEPAPPATALNDRSPNVPILSPATYSTEPPSTIPPSTRKPVKKGKKKRSAHANALNVHHRDNYVPSRIPTSHQNNSSSHHDGTPPLTSWPASAEAIAAAGGSRPNTSFFAGPEEWLCAFCDYDLFYGPNPAAAIKKRKKILKVRKKAKERASKATGSAVPAPVPEDGQEEELEE